jgi:ferredoxin-NADP reductase
MIWDEDDDGALVCRAVWAETHNVKTFLFAPVKPARFAFLAGQFLTFSFPVDGADIQRCYTIASPPTRPDCVAITVKRKAGGIVSPWLHDTLRPGMTVSATGPMGDFTDATAARAKWALLAAGSGITPMMSLLRRAADCGMDRDIVLINSAHAPRDLIFRDELALLARALPGLRVLQLVSQSDSMWSGLRGRLSRAVLDLVVPDLSERSVLCCGPAGYHSAVQGILSETGFNLAHFHAESFSFEQPVAPSIEEFQTDAQLFTIRFARSGKTISCGATTTVLAAAREAGLRLPFSCAKGVCGTCKTKLLAGRVDMQHGGGIRPREVTQGLALLCCSRPLEDLVIDR